MTKKQIHLRWGIRFTMFMTETSTNKYNQIHKYGLYHLEHLLYSLPYFLELLPKSWRRTKIEYIEGTMFAINTNESTTTKYSPFFLMFGGNPRLPFEVEKLEQPITDPETLSQVMQDLSSEAAIRERLEEMSRLRDTLFLRVDETSNRRKKNKSSNSRGGEDN